MINISDKEVFNRRSPIIFTLFTLILFLILGMILSTIFNSFNLSQSMPYGTEILSELVLAVIAILIIKKLGFFNKELFSKNNLSLGLKLGFFVILTGIVQLVIYLTLNYNNPLNFAIAPIIGAIIYSFAVGIYEEVFMRGLILQNLMNNYGYSKKGIYKALFLAAIFFGLAHLINLTHAALLDTLVQVVYAMTAGIILGAVFLRTRNLLSVILLHGIFDLFTYLTTAVYAGHFVSYNLIQYPALYIGYNGFLVIGNLIIGLWIARKIKPLEKPVQTEDLSENVVNDSTI